MSCLLYLFLTWWTLCAYLSKSQENITFSAVSVLNTGTIGKSIVGAEWLAMQEINENPNLLPNINLQLNVYDSAGSASQALVHTLDIINTARTQHNETHFPIILGTPWSSLSSITNPALGAFAMGQISSGATSISLSDTSKYPYFYRTIPSDALQARGIILLCNEFNWTKIAIVYVNDVYGLYLSIGIAELAREEGIEATAVAFSSDEPSTLRNAAVQVASLNTFIIVFIVHDTVLRLAFDAFKAIGLTGYPYYYIGADAWLDKGSITTQNCTMFAQGAIGTIPWQTLAMPLDTYDDDIRPIINQSMITYHAMLSSWATYWSNGYQNELRVEAPSSTAIYGYDAMYTLAYALQKYIDDGHANVGHLHEHLNISLLNEITLNEVSFVGASGNVFYDKNGDREEGLYALGNALTDGTIDYFGYFYENNGDLKLSVAFDNIIWPKDFVERGMTPQSDVVTHTQIVAIEQGVLIPIYVLTIISMIVVIVYAFLTVKYHSHSVLRAASWKINLVMCVGCLCGYTSTMVYGVDENNGVEAGPMFSFLCNFRIWLWVMSYTLLFMPLFVKTYRLSQIFSEILEKRVLEDKHLLYMVLGCVAVDIVLLVIYTSIEALQRMYVSGSYEQIDQLQRVHYQYGSCESENGIHYIFYGLIALWKTIESLFGIYCALSVSRVGRQELSQFDETTQQLLAIGFLVGALCIAIPVGALGPTDNPSYFFCVVGLLTISVGNVTASLNMLPRLLAVIQGKTAAYTQSPEKKMEMLIRKQLKKIGVDEEWWKKHGGDASDVHGSSGKGKESKEVSSVRLAMPTQSGATNREITEASPLPVGDDVEAPPPPAAGAGEPPLQLNVASVSAVDDDDDDAKTEATLSGGHATKTVNQSINIDDIVDIFNDLEEEKEKDNVMVMIDEDEAS
eukprot:3601_1